MTTLDQLIDFYGQQDSDALPANPAFAALCAANDARKMFHADRAHVEKVKRKLEKTVGIQQTRQGQVMFAIQVFQQLMGTPLLDAICLRLVDIAYYPDWTPKQQMHYTAAIAQIKRKMDYFLSFTQRRRGDAGNPVNGYHRYLIQHGGIPDPVAVTTNQLARFVSNHLQDPKYGFGGFYFPTHEDDSQDIVAKVMRALDDSLVFVQIVQNAMFSKEFPQMRNYCFEEYSDAIRLQKKTIYLFADGILPGDLIRPEAVDIGLDDWYQVTQGTDCVDLQPTRDASESANIIANLDKLKEHVVEKIHRFRRALWEGVPSDLD